MFTNHISEIAMEWMGGCPNNPYLQILMRWLKKLGKSGAALGLPVLELQSRAL